VTKLRVVKSDIDPAELHSVHAAAQIRDKSTALRYTASRYGITQKRTLEIVNDHLSINAQNGTGELALIDPFNLFGSHNPTPYNPSELASSKGMWVYDQMRRDDQVKAALQFKKLAVMAAGWAVTSPDGQEGDWEPTEFIATQFTDMPGSFNATLLEMLTGLDFGFSVTEIVLEAGDKATLKALKTKRPHFFNFKTDEYGNLLPDGLQQDAGMNVRSTGPSGRIDLPVNKFVIYSHQREFSNYYGRSDLDAAYRAWWAKENAYRWLQLLLQRYGVPPIFALYNKDTYNVTQQNQLYNVLKNMQGATMGMMPKGGDNDLELWTPEIANQATSVFQPALDMFNADIARAILVPSQLGMTPDTKVGSFAKSKVNFDSFMLVVEHLQRDFAEQAINDQLIRPLIDLNFGPQDTYPQFKFLPVKDEVRSELLDSWQKLLTGGSVESTAEDEAHIRSLMKFPERDMSEDDPEDSGIKVNELYDYHIERGVVTVNEVRTMMGLQPVEGGDKLYEPPEPAKPEGEEEDDEGEPESLPGSGADEEEDGGAKINTEFSRHRTSYEAKVDFTQVTQDFDDLDAGSKKAVSDAMANMRTKTLAFIQKQFKGNAAFVTQLKEIRGTPALRKEIKTMLKHSFDAGRKTVKQELETAKDLAVADTQAIENMGAGAFKELDAALRYADDPTFVPQDALKRLRAREFWITGIIEDDILADARNVLLMAVENGEPMSRTMEKLDDVFKPFILPEELGTGTRLETIVRTNVTDAYNRGRLVEARRAGPLLKGFEYSAVLDSRTTEVCSYLDGKVFRADDPGMDALIPPRHFNCRSILVPVTLGEPVDSFTTRAEEVKGVELSGKGFK
jgi:SPP1 gp7 family putative phage head morphogenesis protein